MRYVFFLRVRLSKGNEIQNWSEDGHSLPIVITITKMNKGCCEKNDEVLRTHYIKLSLEKMR